MVLRGIDEWLFLQADENDVIGQHTGTVKLSRFRHWRWRRMMRRRTDLQKTLGFAWTHEIVPDKEAVYAEHLPASVVPARRRPVHEILGVADASGAPAHYLLADLQAAKGGGPLYSKTDTHWNQRGAFVAYRSIGKRLAERGSSLRILDESEVNFSERDELQDLGSKLHPHVLGVFTAADLDSHRSLLVFDNRIKHAGRVMIFEQDAPDLPNAVVFGDSFAMQLLVFLKESFQRLVYVHTSSVVPGIVAAERPEVVLTVSIERFMIRPPSDRGALAALRNVARTKQEWGAIHETDDVWTAPLPHDPVRLDPAMAATIPW